MSTPNRDISNSRTSLGNDVGDIETLLYLEALKRFKDNEAHIKRQVEEKMRVYEAVRMEYTKTYEKYVRLVKLLGTRIVLDKETSLASEELATAADDIASIMKITGTGEMCDHVPTEVLDEFKKNLATVQQHTELAKLRKEHDEMKALLRSMQTTEQALENIVEVTTIQSLDYFMNHVQTEE